MIGHKTVTGAIQQLIGHATVMIGHTTQKKQPLNCFLRVVLWSMVHGNADQPKLSIIVLANEKLGPVQISLQIAISHTVRSMPCEYLTTGRLRWIKRHPFGDLAGDQYLRTSCALSTIQIACCTMSALH